MSKILKFLSMVAVAVSAIFVSSCSSNDEELDPFYYCSVADFQENIDAVKTAGAQYVIIDYRDAASYAAGHIPGAINHEATAANTKTNNTEFSTWIKGAYPTSTYIFLYGSDASMEYYVAGRVSKLGYGKVHTYSLSSGYKGWVAAGKSTEK